MAIFVAIGLAIVSTALSLLLAPKPKAPKPEAAKDLENPVAEAGKPIPVVFGTITVKGLDVLWSGDKSLRTYKTKA